MSRKYMHVSRIATHNCFKEYVADGLDQWLCMEDFDAAVCVGFSHSQILFSIINSFVRYLFNNRKMDKMGSKSITGSGGFLCCTLNLWQCPRKTTWVVMCGHSLLLFHRYFRYCSLESWVTLGPIPADLWAGGRVHPGHHRAHVDQ